MNNEIKEENIINVYTIKYGIWLELKKTKNEEGVQRININWDYDEMIQKKINNTFQEMEMFIEQDKKGKYIKEK